MNGRIAELRRGGRKMKAAPLRERRGLFHESYGTHPVARAYFLLTIFWMSAGTVKVVSGIVVLYSTLVTVMTRS